MRVSVREVLRNFSYYTDKALAEPVIITKNGRDRIVMISAEEFAMMRDLIDGEAGLAAAVDKVKHVAASLPRSSRRNAVKRP